LKLAAFVGFSGSGKTTLLEKLVKELKRRGRTVAVIKRSSHHFDLSPEGKDAQRYLAAGADGTVVLGPDRLALLRRVDAGSDPEAEAETYFRGMDYVLIEGGKGRPFPIKIEVLDRSSSRRRVCRDDEIAALISQDPVETGLPVFHPDQIRDLADFLEKGDEI